MKKREKKERWGNTSNKLESSAVNIKSLRAGIGAFSYHSNRRTGINVIHAQKQAHGRLDLSEPTHVQQDLDLITKKILFK